MPCDFFFLISVRPQESHKPHVDSSDFPLTCHKHSHFLCLADNNKQGGPMINNPMRAVLFPAGRSLLTLVSAQQDLGA